MSMLVSCTGGQVCSTRQFGFTEQRCSQYIPFKSLPRLQHTYYSRYNEQLSILRSRLVEKCCVQLDGIHVLGLVLCRQTDILYILPWHFALRITKVDLCTARFDLDPLEGNNNHWNRFSGDKLSTHVQYVEAMLKL